MPTSNTTGGPSWKPGDLLKADKLQQITDVLNSYGPIMPSSGGHGAGPGGAVLNSPSGVATAMRYYRQRPAALLRIDDKTAQIGLYKGTIIVDILMPVADAQFALPGTMKDGRQIWIGNIQEVAGASGSVLKFPGYAIGHLVGQWPEDNRAFYIVDPGGGEGAPQYQGMVHQGVANNQGGWDYTPTVETV